MSALSIPRENASQPTRFFQKVGGNPGEILPELLHSTLVLAEDWEALPGVVKDKIRSTEDQDMVLAQLAEHGLLTDYQAARIRAGTTFGLVLGNYRILDRLGAGGMAVVFKAEHMELRNLVAIKVLPFSPEQDPRLQTRFSAEMRIVARLRHPNIVAAVDCGRASSGHTNQPVLWYLVMEYVAGQDLEDYVHARGPFVPAKACNIVHQVACALAEIHKFNLVHRDIKPSNVILTFEEQAKLLDFGLSRRIDTRLTQPGTFLGTIDYMAPEQAQDASSVDIRADIYGLGGTLYWCLTGHLPFPAKGNPTLALAERLTKSAPSLRKHLPDLPEELDAVVAKMMAIKPEDRYQSPQAVMQAMLPFLRPDSMLLTAPMISLTRNQPLQITGLGKDFTPPRSYKVLIVDDEPAIRDFSRAVLSSNGLNCDVASDGPEAITMAAATPYDLVLLDMNLPTLAGVEVLRRLRETPPCPHCKIIMCSGAFTPDEMAQLLASGADDYLNKPFSLVQLQRKCQAALRLKEAQDRTDLLNRHLLSVNAELERSLSNRDCDLKQVRNALVLALARLVSQRDSENAAHLSRLPHYCRILTQEAGAMPNFASQIDENFIEMLECCAPLHDIGKVSLPDHILLKPGKLTSEERIVMQTHTLTGADTLKDVAVRYPHAQAFLQMAIDIARHHHEKYDGTGYPDRLKGNGIPLAARIVAVCDVYDALRRRRSYKPALSHQATIQMMTETFQGHFDPALLQAFLRCQSEMDRIHNEIAD